MATIPSSALNPVVFEIPEPPEEFGQDGGRFYRSYDAFAEEIDEDLTNGLKEQLDGLPYFPVGSLHFQAGLFAGINSAFLALTLPLLSADPADDTNALLTQNNAILMQLAMGRNDSLPNNSDLPSNSFYPSSNILAVNVLFSLSLTFALISSFLAVIGRQWLVYYRKRSGGGLDRQRWEQLKRFLGAERWRLELILDDILPSLLQIGLIAFCVALVIYLDSLNPTVSRIVGIPMYAGLAFFVGSAMCTIWDRFCPFQSPLSHLLSSFVRSIAPIWRFVQDFWILHRGLTYHTDVRRAARNRQEERSIKFKEFTSSIFNSDWYRVLISIRPEEPIDSLQVTALRRLICTSEDPATLLTSAANILTIHDSDRLIKLWGDEIFRARLMGLYRGSADRTLKFLGRGRVELASAVRQLYTAATAQFVVYMDLNIEDFLSVFRCLSETEGFRTSTIWIPEAMPHDTSPFYNQLSLTLAIISIFGFQPPVVEIQNFCGYLGLYSDALINPDWRSLSLLAWIISQLPRIKMVSHQDIGYIRKVLRGDTVAGLESIDSALRMISEGGEMYTLDRNKVLTNMMRCTSQVVADECPHPDLRLDQVIRILQRAERVLRSPACSEEIRRFIEKIRKDTVTEFIRICFTSPQPGLRIAEISEDVFEALIMLFITLKDPRPARFSAREDAEALNTFTPLIEEILSDTVQFHWEDEFYTNKAAPVILRQRLDAVQGTWAEFLEDVENLSTVHRAQSTFKRVRDPDMRWCHWQEEL